MAVVVAVVALVVVDNVVDDFFGSFVGHDFRCCRNQGHELRFLLRQVGGMSRRRRVREM